MRFSLISAVSATLAGLCLSPDPVLESPGVDMSDAAIDVDHGLEPGQAAKVNIALNAGDDSDEAALADTILAFNIKRQQAVVRSAESFSTAKKRSENAEKLQTELERCVKRPLHELSMERVMQLVKERGARYEQIANTDEPAGRKTQYIDHAADMLGVVALKGGEQKTIRQSVRDDVITEWKRSQTAKPTA